MDWQTIIFQTIEEVASWLRYIFSSLQIKSAMWLLLASLTIDFIGLRPSACDIWHRKEATKVESTTFFAANWIRETITSTTNRYWLYKCFRGHALGVKYLLGKRKTYWGQMFFDLAFIDIKSKWGSRASNESFHENWWLGNWWLGWPLRRWLAKFELELLDSWTECKHCCFRRKLLWLYFVLIMLQVLIVMKNEWD